MAKFKLDNVFRTTLSSKKIGEMELEKFMTDDKLRLIFKVTMGTFVVEKSFQNNLYGKELLADFEGLFKTEDDLKKYLGV